MASFFSFFFVRPQSSSRMYHFLQKLIRLLRPTQSKSGQWKLSAKGPPFHFKPFLRNLQNRKRPKGPPFQFFSALCEIFFENFLRSQKSPSFEFFFKKKFQKFSNFILFPVGKQSFSSHIEHERHTLRVSKVFSKLFMNTS